MLNTKNLIPLILALGFISNTAFAKQRPEFTPEQKAVMVEMDKRAQEINELSKKLGPNFRTQINMNVTNVDSEKQNIEQVRKVYGAPHAEGYHPNRSQIRRIDIKQRVGLGIVMSPNAGGNGVKLAAVSPNSPAKASGLQSGDIITAIDGKTISAKDTAGVEQARKLLGNLKEGQNVKLTYARNGKSTNVTLKAAKVEPQMVMNRDIRGKAPMMVNATRWQGLNMTELNPQLGRYFGTSSGVLVLNPHQGFAQLQPGDVITKIEGKAVSNSRDVMLNIHGKKEGEKINLEILRDRKTQSLTVTAPKPRSMNAPKPPRPPLPPMTPPPPAPPAPPAPPRVAFLLNNDVENILAFHAPEQDVDIMSVSTDGSITVDLLTDILEIDGEDLQIHSTNSQ